MRRVLSLVAVGFVLQAVGAQGQSPTYDTSVTANDWLATALWRIAASTNTRIGFEATDHTRHFRKQIPALPVSTLENALNAVVGADDRYEWRRMRDFVIVRPKGAWDDSSNPFNRQIRPVHVENATPLAVLQRVRNVIYTGAFAPDQPQPDGVPVSFELSSGTVIDVLNELMAAADCAFWIGSYRPIGRPAERFPRWDLSLEVFDREHVIAFSGSHPPERPAARWNRRNLPQGEAHRLEEWRSYGCLTCLLGFETPNVALLDTSAGLMLAALLIIPWHLAETRALTTEEKRLWIRELTGAGAFTAMSEFLTSPDLRVSIRRKAKDANARRAAQNHS